MKRLLGRPRLLAVVTGLLLAVAAVVAVVSVGRQRGGSPPPRGYADGRGGRSHPPAGEGEARGGDAGLAAACGDPGRGRPYAYVDEKGLPWSGRVPARLAELRRRHGARRLEAAFCATLPDPILEERYNIRRGARLLAGTVVPPGAVLSLNRTIGPYTSARGYRPGPSYVGTRIVPAVGGGVCKIASVLYNAVVAADLTVVERHPHGMLVPYVPPGRDATVSDTANLDFRFRNSSPAPVVLWADSVGGTLFVALYGGYTPPAVAWHHRVLARRPAPVIRRANGKLSPGSERVVMEGSEGIAVRTWLTIARPGGTEVRHLGVDRYLPMPRVVEFGGGG